RQSRTSILRTSSAFVNTYVDQLPREVDCRVLTGLLACAAEGARESAACGWTVVSIPDRWYHSTHVLTDQAIYGSIRSTPGFNRCMFPGVVWVRSPYRHKLTRRSSNVPLFRQDSERSRADRGIGHRQCPGADHADLHDRQPA